MSPLFFGLLLLANLCLSQIAIDGNITTYAEGGTDKAPVVGLSGTIIFEITYEDDVSLTCPPAWDEFCLRIPLSCPPNTFAYFDLESHLEISDYSALEIDSEDFELEQNFDPRTGKVRTLFFIADVYDSPLSCYVNFSSTSMISRAVSFDGSLKLTQIAPADPKNGKVVLVNTEAPAVKDILISVPGNKTYSSDGDGFAAVITLILSQEVSAIKGGTLLPNITLNTGGVATYTRIIKRKIRSTTVSALEFYYQTVPGHKTTPGFLSTRGSRPLNLNGFVFIGLDSNVMINLTIPSSLLSSRRVSISTSSILFPPAGYSAAQRPLLPDGSAPEVSLRCIFSDIWGISERDQLFQSDFSYEISWYDPRLNIPGFPRKEYKNLLSQPAIWKPDIALWTIRGAIRELSNHLFITDGYVKWVKHIQVPNSFYIRPYDFPFDVQTFQFQFRPGLGSDGNFTWVKQNTTDEQEAELVALYHPAFDFRQLGQEIVNPTSTLYNNTETLMVAFLGQRRAAMSVMLVLLPITFVLIIVYLTFFLQLKMVTRLTIPVYATIAVGAFSVTVSNLLPPTAALTRMVLLIILSFVYVVLTAIPQIFLVLITLMCEEMEKDFKFAKKKEGWDEKKNGGGKKDKDPNAPKPPPGPPPHDYVGELSKNFLWIWVINAKNYEEYWDKLEFWNSVFRVTHILILLAFLCPVFLLPSTIPEPYEFGQEYVEAEGTDPFRYDAGIITISVYVGIVGGIFLCTFVAWLLFHKKAEPVGYV